MSKFAELQQQRNAAAERVRELGAKFEANGKKWKPGEKTEWESANLAYDRAVKAMDDIKIPHRLAEVDNLQNAVDDSRVWIALPDAGGNRSRASQQNAPTFQDAATGREIRALLNNQPISALATADDEDDEDDDGKTSPPVGALLHSMLTGQPQNITRGQFQNSIGSTDSTGGYILNPGLSGQLIDLARSASVALRAGALTLPMDVRELSIARIASDPTPFWRPEGVGVNGSILTFDRLTLRAKTLAAIVPVSIELLEDAANAASIITQALQAAMGLALDKAVLIGAGNEEEPRGIRNQSGVGSITGVGTPADYSDLTTAIGSIFSANYPGDASGLAWVSHPRDAETYDGLTDSTGQPLMPTPWAGALKRFTTTSLPTDEGGGSNESIGIVGDFSQVLIGMRTKGANVRILDAGNVTDADGKVHDAASELKKLIVVYLRADVAVMRPAWLSVLAGITAT